MSKQAELRSCPRCGSTDFMYLEVGDSSDGKEMYDFLECEKCGCKYKLVFEYVKKEES